MAASFNELVSDIDLPGMIHIIGAFLITYFFYRAVFRFYFMGFLNFMILFIILGIGADDIFLFVDAWKQSHVAGEETNRSLGTDSFFFLSFLFSSFILSIVLFSVVFPFFFLLSLSFFSFFFFDL